MTNGDGAAKFHQDSYDIALYGDIILYAVVAIDIVICIGYMLHTQGWSNYTLFILLVNILVYAVLSLVFYFFYANDREQWPFYLMSASAAAVSGLVHWVITQSYLRVAYETSQIIDKGVLFNDRDKLAAVYRFKTRIKIANVLCPCLILAFSVCIYFGMKNENGLFYNIGWYGWLALVTIFTLTWGWTLHKLYRDTKRSKKLLPDKRIFILHGSLLVSFLLVQAI